MFVAIFGFATDGHRFVEAAIDRGAAVIVHQADLARYHDDVVYLKVTDCRRLLGHIASRFFGHPSEKITVTGITGTNGKTSSTYFLTGILRAAGKKCARMGTLVMLHHFTSPAWLAAEGGIAGPRTPGLFARYVDCVSEIPQ